MGFKSITLPNLNDVGEQEIRHAGCMKTFAGGEVEFLIGLVN